METIVIIINPISTLSKPVVLSKNILNLEWTGVEKA